MSFYTTKPILATLYRVQIPVLISIALAASIAGHASAVLVACVIGTAMALLCPRRWAERAERWARWYTDAVYLCTVAAAGVALVARELVQGNLTPVMMIGMVATPIRINPERLPFYRLLYQQDGWVEVSAAAPVPDDPDTITLRTNLTRWVWIDPRQQATYEQLDSTVQRIVDGGLDVYVSAYQYSQNKRHSNYRLPATVLFFDDVTDLESLPFTPAAAVQTSAGNWHVYVRLAAPATPAAVCDVHAALCRRIGAGTNSVNKTQIVRVPATVNGKRKHGGYVVQLDRINNAARYTLEELHQMGAPAAAPAAAPACGGAVGRWCGAGRRRTDRRAAAAP